MKNCFIRVRRYLWFLVQYLLCEKPRGLDFTMRDISLYDKSGGIYHGYSKTNEKHLHTIFERLQKKEELSLLDIGCGKGVVLKEAVKYSFKKVDGIEIQPQLVEIAEKNFKILGIDDKIGCIRADAAQFTQYGNYNLFFLFNPFSEAILQTVVNKIVESRDEKNNTAIIIYHNPVFLSVFETNAKVIRKEYLHDSLKNYDTCILCLEKLGSSAEFRSY